MPQGPRQNRKKCVTFLRGGGGSPEERPYDVSRGQNRHVTLPLHRNAEEFIFADDIHQ